MCTCALVTVLYIGACVVRLSLLVCPNDCGLVLVQVIQGAETTLRRLTPAVYFSGDQEASRTDASAILESWGYVCREHRMRLFDPQPVMGQRGPVVCNTGTCLVPPSSPEVILP